MYLPLVKLVLVSPESLAASWGLIQRNEDAAENSGENQKVPDMIDKETIYIQGHLLTCSPVLLDVSYTSAPISVDRQMIH